MAKRYLLGLRSNGTTGVKCKVYDLEGNIMGEGYREYACVYPKPGWTEQDISMLMEANYEALGDVLKKSGVDPSEVAGMGLSTQRALHFYIDKDGKILRDGLGISWQDGRTPSRCSGSEMWSERTATLRSPVCRLDRSGPPARSSGLWRMSRRCLSRPTRSC